MRPTDDERREVAARLRDMAPGSDWPNYVAEACGMDVSKMSNNLHTFTEQLCQRIADLIEPEERTCHIVMISTGVWECDECFGGIDWDSYDEDDPPNCNFCPNCGAKVVE